MNKYYTISRDDIRVANEFLKGNLPAIEGFCDDNYIYGEWKNKRLVGVPLAIINRKNTDIRNAYLEEHSKLTLRELGKFGFENYVDYFRMDNGFCCPDFVEISANNDYKKIVECMNKYYVGSVPIAYSEHNDEDIQIAEKSARKAEILLYVATILSREARKKGREPEEYIKSLLTLVQTACFNSDDSTKILNNGTSSIELLDEKTMKVAKSILAIDLAVVWQEIVNNNEAESEEEKEDMYEIQKSAIEQHFKQRMDENELDHDEILIRTQIETANIVNQLFWMMERQPASKNYETERGAEGINANSQESKQPAEIRFERVREQLPQLVKDIEKLVDAIDEKQLKPINMPKTMRTDCSLFAVAFAVYRHYQRQKNGTENDFLENWNTSIRNENETEER